jgi:hypothetical protein
MPRGEQLQVRAPGCNEKCSVSCATDVGEGALLWRTDERRCADQFCATLAAGADRSTVRGRLAVFLVDNAKSHRVGKTGIVRRAWTPWPGGWCWSSSPPTAPTCSRPSGCGGNGDPT